MATMGPFLGGFQVYGFKRVTSTWLWLILAIYVSWAKRKFLLDTGFPASNVFIFSEINRLLHHFGVQSSLLIWSCFILRFTVLTFCWFNLNLRGFGLVSPNLHPKCWSFLVGKPHGFVGYHHFGKPPIYRPFWGELNYTFARKKPAKAGHFFAGSPRASEKTLWWAAQVVTRKQWGIHRIPAVRKEKGEFEVNDFLSLVVSNYFLYNFSHLPGEMIEFGRFLTLMDLWPSWIYGLGDFFWCHRSTESHQCNTSWASGNIGWRHLLFQIDDINLNVPSKQAQLGIPIV